MKTLILIPARGGSKGLPGKNIRHFLGKPLIIYTIEEAIKFTKSDFELCISTDSEEIKAVVESFGYNVPFLRPAEFSTDNSNSESVIKHALNWYAKKYLFFKNIILLQPTSPLRKSHDINAAYELFDKTIDMVVSVNICKSNPYYNIFEENQSGYLIKSKESFATRRQDCPAVYEINGAIYIINIDSLKSKGFYRFNKIIKYQMNNYDSIDIDTELDFKFAEFIFQHNLKKL